MEDTLPVTHVTTAHPQHIPFLTTMHSDQLNALIMIAVHDMYYRDAATLLNVPIGSVKSRVNRARGRLRRMIASRGPAARIELKALVEWKDLDKTHSVTERLKALKLGKAMLYRIAEGTDKGILDTEHILRSLVQPRHGPE